MLIILFNINHLFALSKRFTAMLYNISNSIDQVFPYNTNNCTEW